MRDPTQLSNKWVHRKTANVSASGTTESIADGLSLALALAEQVVAIAKVAPFIAPAPALLSEILKSYKEAKRTNEKRDILATYIADLTGDLCTAVLRLEAAISGDLMRHLKLDLQKYSALITRASEFVEKYDNQGNFVRWATRNAQGEEFEKLIQDLKSFGARFSTNRLVDLAIGQNTVSHKLEKIHEMALEEKLEKWFRFPPDMTQKQYDTEKLRKDGTGRWFLESEEFTEWQNNAGTLWIEGPSGAGKSVLSSTVIHALFEDKRLPETLGNPHTHSPAVAFYYFDFRKNLKSHASAVYTSPSSVEIAIRRIILQLSAQSTWPYKILDKQYQSYDGQKLPSRQESYRILQELLRELNRTYIILDALDECDNTNIGELINFVSMLRTWSETPLHLLLTSQTRRLFTKSFENVVRVSLEFDVMQEDIKLFISNELDTNSDLEIWRPYADQIITRVARKSGGMFRLAACILFELSCCSWTGKEELEATLEKLPNDLFGIYDRFLLAIREEHLVYVEAAIRWIMFSFDLMNLDRLAELVSFDFSNPLQHTYKPDRLEGNVVAIQKWLAGLVAEVESEGQKWIVLAHASVQDYLLSEHCASKFGLNFDSSLSHSFIARTCLAYTCYFAKHPHTMLDKDQPTNHPLERYAFFFRWHHSVRSSHGRSNGPQSTLQVEDSGSHFSAYRPRQHNSYPASVSAPSSSLPVVNSKPLTVQHAHLINLPTHRSEWVMWVGNIPSNTAHDELWRFFTAPAPTSPSDTGPTSSVRKPLKSSWNSAASGVLNIFLVSPSSCAFVTYDTETALKAAIVRFNGVPLRHADPLCTPLVCRARRQDEDIRTGVNGQLGMGMHTQYVREQERTTETMAWKPQGLVLFEDKASQYAWERQSSFTPDRYLVSPHNHSYGLSRSSGTISTASTNSILLAKYFPQRFFILKSLRTADLDRSVRSGTWATEWHNEGILDQAFRTSRDVLLIFSVIKSREFYGYARMSGSVGQSEIDSGIEGAAAKNGVLTGLLSATERDPLIAKTPYSMVHKASTSMPAFRTPDTFVRSKHQHGMAYKEKVWQGASSRFKRIAGEPDGASTDAERHNGDYSMNLGVIEQWGQGPQAPGLMDVGEEDENTCAGQESDYSWSPRKFKLEWLCTDRLPFDRTLNIRNPWNHNLEVKVSRNMTELEPGVGQALLHEW